MKLCDLNPFMRYAALQPSVMSKAPLSCAYDYRIFYILEGEARLILEQNYLDLAPGTLLYFRPGTPYYFDGKVKVIVLNFDLTRSYSHQKKPMPPSLDVESFEESLVLENDPPVELKDLILVEKAFDIQGKIQECLLHYRYPTRLSDAFTSATVKEILCYIAQRSNSKEPEIPELVQKVTLYIQQNYDREIDNTQIANEFGYHSFYLNRIFKRSTGVTIHQAVINERMRMAKKLLKETALSVNAISNEVGYADHTRFCTAFKKGVGVTPLEYRKSRK